LKPLSAAVPIGTGGPFGAEGPIIATGSAFGSLVGQLLHTTATERKTLLAAGAAAGMAAAFGSPVSAVLLAVELLLFEFRPRSLIPVALASAAAAGARLTFTGGAPVFAMPDVTSPGGLALAFYVALGAVVGVASVGVTKAVYWVEELFERLPLPWAVWPAIGGVAVGLIGFAEPRTLGVGYENIEQALRGAHQGFPVVTEGGSLRGVLTRRDLLEPTLDPTAHLAELVQRPPLVAFTDSSLREAADHMLRAGVGRLPVVERAHPTRVVGFLTRSDVLAAHRTRLREATHAERSIPRLDVDSIAAEAKDA
jgi:hypothetical protein